MDRWWTRLGDKGIVEQMQRIGVARAFRGTERVAVCPGWHVSYSWPMDEAEVLDERRGDRLKWTAFVTAVDAKIRAACAVMGQDFDDL